MTLKNPKKYTPSSINSVYDNGTYTFTWKTPDESKGLVDYTVYWCYSKRAVRNECNSSLHFQHVDKETHKFTFVPQSVEQEVNLAVSANYINYSTGMHWQPCTVDVNIDLAKVEPEAQATSATTIKVQWSSENICPSVLEGYNLTYCQMLNDQIVQCWDKSIEKNVNKFQITSLRPYTQYKIEMYMYSSKKKGKVSEQLLVQTNEAAPSPPRILQLLQVRNTSAVISWLAPSQPNGILRSYIVKLNNKEIVVPASKTNVTLSDLVSYTSYKVFVIAKTLYPSDNSNDVHFTTLIGYPSAPATELVSDNHNETVITWKKPTEPAGRIEYYEVSVTEMRGDQIMHRRISIVVGNTSCIMKMPRCIDYEYKTTIDVRAVNVAVLPSEVSTIDDDDIGEDASDGNLYEMHYDASDEFTCSGGVEHTNVNEWLQRYRNASNYRLFKSQWGRVFTNSCSDNRISKITVIALIVVLSSMSVMLAVYLGRRKYYKMANIRCTLPPDLDRYITKDSSVGGGGGGGNGSMQAQAREEEERMSSEKHIWHYNNEKHLLLDSSGSDSGAFSTRYIGEASSTISDNTTAAEEGKCKSLAECIENNEVAAPDFNVGESLNGNGNKAGYATMKPGASLAAPYSLLAKIDNNGGNYIKPLQIDWQLQTKDQQQHDEKTALPLTTLKPSNGYVSFSEEQESEPQKTSPIERIAITPGGYMKPSALTTSTTSIPSSQPRDTAPKSNLGGYTTLEQLGKFAPQLSELPPTNVSGYTTLEQIGKALPDTNVSTYTTLDQLEKTAPPTSRTLPQINSNGYTAFEQLTKKDSPASVSSVLEQFGTKEYPASSTLPQQFESHVPPLLSALPLTNASGYTTLEQMGKNSPKAVPSAFPQTNPSEYTTLQQLVQNASLPPSTLPQINSSGYTTLEQMGKNTPQIISFALPQTNASEYTTLENLANNVSQPSSTLPQASSSAYTTMEHVGKKASQDISSALPPANLNGYTTLGELGIIATNAAHDEPRTTGISGYVTQRELTAFGQNRN